MAGTRILLVDNGSYEPAATLALRGLAQEVGKLIGQEVRPVSTMHSTKIDPALLGGSPAVIFEQAVQQAKADGIDELVVLPLFIGPSRAITEYLPKVFADAQPGAMKLSIRDPLFGEDGAELTGMLADNLRATGWTKGSGTVLLCDHGSPIPEVTACRNALAASLRQELGLKPEELIACSMERREGAEYDFNEPLLVHALQDAKGDAVILMLFLLPGRHAGAEGDVATIAKEHAPAGLRWKLSPLLGTHPALPALLFRRHLYSPGFKLTKIAAIIAVLSVGLLPVLIGVLAPKSLGMPERLMILLGGVATIFTALFCFLKAKVWKKA
ncbi:MAG: cobalamin biosynthesis protein CbiX [Verrucomicrobia bacterium]|nr:cobalamin biosynthesis protein CbiX [Verrucomicrobiota bacterium]